jgi:hypothetical protein
VDRLGERLLVLRSPVFFSHGLLLSPASPSGLLTR